MQLPGLTIGIVADDLTGACDTALQFFHGGCATRVLLSAAASPTLTQPGKEALAITTESRHLDPHRAAAVVRQATATLRDDFGVEHFYKKMDSTLRGHFTAECLAMLDELRWDCALIAPAYPQEGRRTVGGYQLVKGIPVEKTEVGRDPLFPVGISHIPTRMAQRSRADIIGHIELGTVLRGAGPTLAKLTELIEAGKRLIVADACSRTDLDQIALALEKIQPVAKVLPCGSAGFAESLCRHWAPHGKLPPKPLTLPPSPILAVVGTATALTRRQILQLMDHYPYYDDSGRVSVLEPSAEQLLGLVPTDQPQAGECDALLTRLIEAFGQANTVVLTSALTPDQVSRTHTLALANGIDEHDVPERVQQALTALTTQALRQSRQQSADSHPLKLVLTGGETATHICRALGCEALDIVGEVESAIPLLATVADARHPDQPTRWVVTKSGNFGTDLTLAAIIRFLKQHERPLAPAD